MSTARHLLKLELSNFDFFKALSTELREKLSSVAEYEHREAGETLFLQGDAPGACYLIVSGEVGIFTRPVNKRQSLVDGFPQMAWEPDTTSPHRKRRTIAVAGGSAAQDLGNLDSVVGPGKVVGLLAHLENAPRTASVKCNEDCKFIVISHTDFNQVLRDAVSRDLGEKQSFLESRLPGLRDFAASFIPVTGKSHPTYMFTEQRYCSGQVIHNEGSIAEGALYVVISGCVEFYRVAQSSNPPGPPIRKQLGSLIGGGLFSSMHVVTGSSSPEPFTVIAGSRGCEVYCCAGENLQKLPSKVLNPVRTQLAMSARLRLERFNGMLAFEEKKAREGLKQMRLDKAKIVIGRLTSKDTDTPQQLPRSSGKLSRSQSCTLKGRGMPRPQKEPKASKAQRGKVIIHNIIAMPQLLPKSETLC